MSRTRTAAANILLLNLEKDAGRELAAVLARSSYRVSQWRTADEEFFQPAELGKRIRSLKPDVICFSAPAGCFSEVLSALRAGEVHIPAVAVSVTGGVDEWLDAIEAGAWDYFWGPFLPQHVSHVIENAIKCEPLARGALQRLNSRN